MLCATRQIHFYYDHGFGILTMNQVRVIGVVWYRPEDYYRIRSISEGRDKLPETYEEWIKEAEFGFHQLTMS